jgi:hypothetical protein
MSGIWESEDGTTLYTHGPDCPKGPNCCCGFCNFIKIGANCSPECCKCVPRWLCAVFYPDVDPDNDKIKPHTILSKEEGWTGSIDGIDPDGIDDSIIVELYRDEEDVCYYKLSIPARDIEILTLIEGGLTQCDSQGELDTRFTCQNPRWQFDEFVLNGETGTLIIERKLLETVPFFSPKMGGRGTVEATEPCGTCTEWCEIICLDWTSGNERGKDEFRLFTDPETGVQHWAHDFLDGEFATISITDVDGVCTLAIDHRDLGEFNSFPISTPCSLGMNIEATDPEHSGKSIILSCNRCSCWDYICEACRCVCPVLCVTSITGPGAEDVIEYDLIWDPDKIRWGTDEKWVSVVANPDTGNCEFYVSGWMGTYGIDYDPEISSIDAECGGQMSYFLADKLPEAVEDGNYRYEFARCRECEPDCFGPLICAECCTTCDNPEMPRILYFDLIGRPVAGGEEPPPDPVRCIELYDIPLVHRQPLFAERHRWEGKAIVSCGCPQDAETPDPDPDDYFIDIVITCSGDTWTLDVTIKRSEGQIGNDSITNSDTETYTFDCSPISWTGELTLGGSINADLCCCDLALTMDFVVSE